MTKGDGTNGIAKWKGGVSALLLLPLGTSAYAASPIAFAVERAPGAQGCPDQPALTARVESILGRSLGAVRGRSEGASISVRFSRTAEGYAASVRFEGPSRGERQLRDASGTCDPLAEAVSVSLALVIEKRGPTERSDARPAGLPSPPAASAASRSSAPGASAATPLPGAPASPAAAAPLPGAPASPAAATPLPGAPASPAAATPLPGAPASPAAATPLPGAPASPATPVVASGSSAARASTVGSSAARAAVDEEGTATSDGDRWRGDVGVTGGPAWGFAADVAWMIAGRLHVRPAGRIEFGVALHQVLERELPAATAAAQASLRFASVEICRVWGQRIRVSPCVHYSLGVLYGEGVGYAEDRTSNLVWSAFGGDLWGSVVVAKPLFLALGCAAWIPTRSLTFSVRNAGAVMRTPPAAAAITLGIGVDWGG